MFCYHTSTRLTEAAVKPVRVLTGTTTTLYPECPRCGATIEVEA